MRFQDLSFQLYTYSTQKKIPQNKFWPSTIEIDSKLLIRLEYLYRKSIWNLHEYKVYFVDVHHEIISTPIAWGDRKSVRYKSSTNLKYVKISDLVLEKQVYHNGQIFARSNVKKQDLKDRSYVYYVLDAHSHPVHKRNNQRHYTFYSYQDLCNLFNSTKYMKGLVTNEIWLCCKTNEFVSNFKYLKSEELSELSIKYFRKDSDFLYTLKQMSKKYGMVFYKGSFGSKLVRI